MLSWLYTGKNNGFPILDTVPPESIYPLARGKTSSLPKGSAANSPRWDEFLNLVLDGCNRTPRQDRRSIRGEETIEANFFC